MKMFKPWSEVLYKKTSKIVLICILIIVVYIAIAIHFEVNVKPFGQTMLCLLAFSAIVIFYVARKEYIKLNNEYKGLNRKT